MSHKKVKKENPQIFQSENEVSEILYHTEPDTQLSNQEINNTTDSYNDNNKKFICAGCKKSYQSYPALYLHQKNKHKGETIGKIYPPHKGQGRTGRPRRDQNNIPNEEKSEENIKQLFLNEEDILLDEDDSDILDQFLFFLTTMKINLKLHINKIDSKAVMTAINQLPQNLIQDSQSLLAQIEIFLNKSDEQIQEFQDLEQQNEFSQTTCNEIFAIFIRELSRFIAPEHIKEIYYFICCYQIAMNQQGWKIYFSNYFDEQRKDNQQEYNNKSEQQISNLKEQYIQQMCNQNSNNEFCQSQNIETAIDISNEFIVEISDKLFNHYKYSEKKFKLLTNKGDEGTFKKNIEQLTKQFCNWLYLKNYTNSQLNSNYS